MLGHLQNNVRIGEFTDRFFLDELHRDDDLPLSLQETYLLRWLLRDGGRRGLTPCGAFVAEDAYYCHNYRAEYDKYYARCFDGFESVARRIHFFGRCTLQELRDRFASALGGSTADRDALERSYIGYLTVRPVLGARHDGANPADSTR